MIKYVLKEGGFRMFRKLTVRENNFSSSLVLISVFLALITDSFIFLYLMGAALYALSFKKASTTREFFLNTLGFTLLIGFVAFLQFFPF